MEPEPQDVTALRDRMESGWTPRFLFFWGHTPGGTVLGKECLSQWYPAPFTADGDTYATAEHYMMAQKAALFGDTHVAEQIRACSHPAEAKELGRHVRDFDEDRWAEHRFQIVTAGSHAKFSQNPALRAFLLATRSRVLVEASPKDTIWGIGIAEKDPRAYDPIRWRGLNLLGFALRHARAQSHRWALATRKAVFPYPDANPGGNESQHAERQALLAPSFGLLLQLGKQCGHAPDLHATLQHRCLVSAAAVARLLGARQGEVG